MYGINTQVNGKELEFGLNNAIVESVQYVKQEATSDREESEYLEVKTSLVTDRIRPVTMVYDGNEKVEDQNHPKFKKAVEDINKKVTQLLSCFVTEDEMHAALSTPISSFKQFAEIVSELITTSQAFEDKEEITIFGQYKWTKGEDDLIARVEVPKDGKHGLVFSKTYPGKWERDESSTGIKFKNEEGDIHPITRNAWFATSNFADSREVKSQTFSNQSSAGDDIL